MRFSRKEKKRSPQIGTLELKILKQFWAQSGQLDARSVLAALTGPSISLSTVQATLERLHRKGLLARTKQSRAYLYEATVSRESLIASLIGDLTEQLAEGRLEPVISGFIELVGDSDLRMLGKLETRAKQRRKERK